MFVRWTPVPRIIQESKRNERMTGYGRILKRKVVVNCPKETDGQVIQRTEGRREGAPKSTRKAPTTTRNSQSAPPTGWPQSTHGKRLRAVTKSIFDSGSIMFGWGSSIITAWERFPMCPNVTKRWGKEEEGRGRRMGKDEAVGLRALTESRRNPPILYEGACGGCSKMQTICVLLLTADQPINFLLFLFSVILLEK